MASVDANGDPMISYPSLSDGLKLTICDLSASTNGNCDQPDDWSTMSLDAEGFEPGMTVDANGDIMISYLDPANEDLKFAICDISASANGNCDQPSDWSKATVDGDAGHIGNNTSIAVDASGNPIISYWQSANDSLKFATCDISASANGNCDQTGDWSTDTVDAEENVGRWTSIAAGANGAPMISYYGGSNRDLKFATFPPADADGDGFTDYVEVYLGTDPADGCPDGPTHDAWPLDMDMNTVLNLTGDGIKYLGKHGCNVATNPECKRLDLDRNGVINLTGDSAKYVGRIGEMCT